MKVAIVFYSFSGNTKRMCVFLQEMFEKRGSAVSLIEIKPAKETTSFFGQCHEVIGRKTPQIIEVERNLENYDFVIFASPVWAFSFAPGLRSYLEKVSGLGNKKTACFLTYGSGTGSGKALNELENILREKQAHILFSKALAGRKSKDKNFIEDKFKPLLEIVS